MSRLYDEADVQRAVDAIEKHREWSENWASDTALCIATDVLDAVAPAIAARAKAEAWDEGYRVATDDFTHSDYCGRKCQCMGIHGQPNPYRADEIEGKR